MSKVFKNLNSLKKKVPKQTLSLEKAEDITKNNVNFTQEQIFGKKESKKKVYNLRSKKKLNNNIKN
jgi:hypothetical protein